MLRQERFEHFLSTAIKSGIFLVMFLPLLIINHSLFPFIFPRTIAFRAIVEICLVLYAFLAYSSPHYRLRRMPLLTIGGVFIGIMILASLQGVNWHHSFWSTYERSEGIVTWLHLAGFAVLLLGVFRTKKDWLAVLKLAVLAGAIQEIYALGEFFHARFALDIGGTRVGGAVGNASFLATYLLMIMVLATYLYRYELKYAKKIYYAAVIGAGLFVLWQTQTRGAVLALAVGIIFFISSWLYQQKQKKYLIFIPILIFCGLSLYGLLVVNKNAPWVQQNQTLYRLASISTTDITTQNRFLVWNSGFQAFNARFLLGWGWENFGVAFNQYFNPRIARDIGSNPWYDRAHNILVETAVSTGAVGLAIYLWLLGWAVYTAWPKKSRESDTTGHLLLVTFLVIYIVQNLFVFDTVNSYILFVVILAYIQFGEKKEHTKMHALPKIFFPAVALASILLLLPALYFFNVRPALANYYTLRAVSLDKDQISTASADFLHAIRYSSPGDEEIRYALVQYARQRVKADGETPETQQLVKTAAAALTDSIKASPQTIQTYVLLSELYLAADNFDPGYIAQAESTALAALARAPRRYQVYTLLGRIKIEQGDYTKGISYLQQATDLNPVFAEGYWNLAIAHILNHNSTEAQELLYKAQTLGFPILSDENISRLIKAYSDSKDLDGTIRFLEILVQKFPENQSYSETLDKLKKIKATRAGVN